MNTALDTYGDIFYNLLNESFIHGLSSSFHVFFPFQWKKFQNSAFFQLQNSSSVKCRCLKNTVFFKEPCSVGSLVKPLQTSQGGLT